MKISGMTIVKNAIQYGYPIVEAVRSILPICDEFIINEGYSDDGTYELIQQINDPKVRIIRQHWDLSNDVDGLSDQTNIALQECTGDWVFYVQADEVIHEHDLPRLKNIMQRHLHDPSVDSFRLKWLHFYGSYYRYRVDYGWFQKEDRIIRNNNTIESTQDALTFRRKDGHELKKKVLRTLLYHYGWVQPEEVMNQRKVNLSSMCIGAQKLSDDQRGKRYDYGDLNRFPVYFGSHPTVMKDWITQHALSQQDWVSITQQYWWHPSRWLRLRYKTPIRQKVAYDS